MPRLSFVRPLWWRKKWATEEDGIIYRAQVTTLSFGYNPLTETISASLTYRTEFFCDVQNRWKLGMSANTMFENQNLVNYFVMSH